LRPIIIHIGPHKTGSTSIQRSLDANIDRLRALGFELPLLGTHYKSPSESHRTLVTPVNRMRVASDPGWYSLLDDAAGNPRTFIITSELLSLHFLKREKLDQLVKVLAGAGFLPRFVYYARDQVSWINSTYVQESKRTYTFKSFDDYVTEALRNPRFDHMKMTAAFQGRSDLEFCARYFSAATRDGLLRSFLECIGINGQDQNGFEAEPQNPNAGTRAVYVGRELARLKHALGLNRADKRVAQDFKRFYTRLRWDREPYSGFDDTLSNQVRAAFADSNHAFAQAFGLPPWDESHPPRPSTRCEFVPEERSFIANMEVRFVQSKMEALLQARSSPRK